MKHAMIMVVHTNFNILQSFIDLFDDERYDFYILVDKKVTVPNEEIVKVKPVKSKLIFLPRININWAGYTQINACMELYKASFENNYDYYHFLQGSDFPIKTPDEIDNFFTKNKGKEFINIYYNEFATFKCGYYHFFVDNPFYRKNKLVKAMNFALVYLQKLLFVKRNKDVKLYHGSALSSLTHECVKFLIESEKEIEKRFKNALAADEVFIQTIVANSKFKDNIYKFENSYAANSRLIDWERREGNSPYTFVKEDYDELINAPEEICFARKFSENKSLELVNDIYKHLKNKIKSN